jgi:hypothetical protein
VQIYHRVIHFSPSLSVSISHPEVDGESESQRETVTATEREIESESIIETERESVGLSLITEIETDIEAKSEPVRVMKTQEETIPTLSLSRTTPSDANQTPSVSNVAILQAIERLTQSFEVSLCFSRSDIAYLTF